MVYDEGFAVEFEDLSFFAFSNYLIENNNDGVKTYKSKCYSTCVGWYHNKDQSQWGCYRALKVSKDPQQVTYSTTTLSNSNVVQKENIIVSSNRINENILESGINKRTNGILYDRLIDPFPSKTMNKMNSFLSVSFSSSLVAKFGGLTSSFNQHHLYINHLNKFKKNWHAELQSEFKLLTIRDLNKIAGIPRNSEFRFSRKKIMNSKPFEYLIILIIRQENTSMYPSNFDWIDKIRTAGSQGSCGSCFAFSTIRMIESRLKILYNENVLLVNSRCPYQYNMQWTVHFIIKDVMVDTHTL